MDNGQDKPKTSFVQNLANKEFFGYSLRDLAFFGLYPVLKTGAVWPTQPLAKIAGLQQSSVIKEKKPLGFIEAAKRIYSTPEIGPRAFWDASIASANRMFVQSLYKGPLQVIANDASKKIVPDNSPALHLFRGLVAGSIVGFTDPVLLGPIERYKTWKLLQQGKSENFVGYIRNICHQQNNDLMRVMKEVYRGVAVTVLKQTMMNGTMFVTKGWAKEFTQPYEKEHPIASMAFSSIAPGMAAAGVGAPADLMKSLIQQHTGQKLTVKELFQATIKKSGWKGLFTGLPAKFVLIATGYSLNALFLNLFDKYRNGDNNDSGHAPVLQQNEAEAFIDQMKARAVAIDPEVEEQLKTMVPHILEALAEAAAEHQYDTQVSAIAFDDEEHLMETMLRRTESSLELFKHLSSEELAKLSLSESDRKEASRALEEFRQIITHTWLDPEYRVSLGVSKALDELYGYKVSEQCIGELFEFYSRDFHKQLLTLSPEELDNLAFDPRFEENLKNFKLLLDLRIRRDLESENEEQQEKELSEQFEAMSMTDNEPVLASKRPSLLFALQKHEESNANYFASLAQRAGDEYLNIPFDLYQEQSDVESKKRVMSKE